MTNRDRDSAEEEAGVGGAGVGGAAARYQAVMILLVAIEGALWLTASLARGLDWLRSETGVKLNT